MSPIARIADGGGPTQRSPAAVDRLGEVRVLGEEPEARVDGIGAGRPSGVDDGGDVQEVDRVGALGGGRDRADAEPLARAPDPDDDLASIRDEQGADRAIVDRPWAPGPAPADASASAMNASNATDATRHRPPTRRAGSRPLAIQRWTDLVVVPIRFAAWLGLSSSSIVSRSSHLPDAKARPSLSRASLASSPAFARTAS